MVDINHRESGLIMEYLIFFLTMGFFLVTIFIKGMWDSYKEEKKFIQSRYNDYGKSLNKEYKLERFVRMGSYYENHPEKDQIDDITWNDLNMDALFKRLNYSFSATGEEYLYHTLRTPKKSKEELEHLEEVIQFFFENPDARVKIQLLMRKLGYLGNYSIYDYLEYLDTLGNRSNLKHILLNILFILFIIFSFFNAKLGLFGAAIIMIYNISTYFREKKEIDPYITSFVYIMRLLDLCDNLIKIPISVCREEWKTISNHKKKFNKMKRGSFWVLTSATINSGGNPLDIIIDYFRMAFHIDLMKFNKMLSELTEHIEDIDILVSAVGYVETAICIGEYRASLNEEWCIPNFMEDNYLEIKEGYHPLIENAVKNSITTERGVLLTGSNASGKSTFLKTVAINAIFAQTIHTVLADNYVAPFYSIYSSMSLKDSLESNESYYMVEIKSLKRIIDAHNNSNGKMLCFVDEVLRGTNTVERISASSQILKSLSDANLVCFAATHDIELTGLLSDYYDNYHFEEDIRDGDVYFNYKLQDGKATTRNAIKLLEIMGYHADIIEKASKQAELFVTTGNWNLA